MMNSNKVGQVYRLGITGGIGSGKTSVCRMFSVLGIPVFYADPEAKLIMNNHELVRERLNKLAGTDLYKTGTLDKKMLAGLIYNDSNMLEQVNNLVHPLVFNKFNEWADNQTSPYVIVEAAILFESGISKLVDRVATVVTPVEERIERVIRRNKMKREQVIDIIKNQMDDKLKMEMSDYIIYNSDSDMIIPKIFDVHKDMLTHALYSKC